MSVYTQCRYNSKLDDICNAYMNELGEIAIFEYLKVQKG